MKFSLDNGGGGYQVVAYADDRVVVERAGRQGEGGVARVRTELRHSALLGHERLIEHWQPRCVGDLTVAHLEPVFEWAPELVLLGTGAKLMFPPARVQRAVTGRGIGLEVMDTPAACRTYNVLMMEQRRVVAALML